MNFSKYGYLYSRFHGCTSFRIENDIMVLDFAHMAFEPWLVTRLHNHDKVYITAQNPFVQAVQLHLKTEVSCSVFCKQDSWTILMGKQHVVLPMPDKKSSTFCLYATPYFVNNPDVVRNLLEGVARPAYDNVFMYKNTILYLDRDDLPYPGGCYFTPLKPPFNDRYRICFLTDEPSEQVARIANEWKNRRDVTTIQFYTRDYVSKPSFLALGPNVNVDFGNITLKFSGMVHRHLSFQKPDFLIQDILLSYLRHHSDINHLGLVVEWPFLITFEGARTNSSDNKKFVGIAVNGQRPNRVLYVRQPTII